MWAGTIILQSKHQKYEAPCSALANTNSRRESVPGDYGKTAFGFSCALEHLSENFRSFKLEVRGDISDLQNRSQGIESSVKDVKSRVESLEGEVKEIKTRSTAEGQAGDLTQKVQEIESMLRNERSPEGKARRHTSKLSSLLVCQIASVHCCPFMLSGRVLDIMGWRVAMWGLSQRD